MADGSVVIDTRMNTGGITKGEVQIQKTMNAIAKNGEKVSDLKRKMTELGSTQVPTEQYARLTTETEKAGQKLEQLLTKKERFETVGGKESTQAYQKLVYDLDTASKKYDNLVAAKQRMEASGTAYTSGATTAEYQKLSTELSNAERRAGELQLQLQAVENTATGKQAAKTSSLKSALTGAAKAATRMTGALKSGVLHIGKMALGGSRLSKSFSGVTRSVKTLIPALLGARGVLGIFRRAVSAFMQENQQLAATLSGVWSGLGNLLGPIIERIIDLVSRAVAYITQFFSLLGIVGKKANSAIKGAGGSAKKETDKLKKQIMSFDELNILQSDKDNDTGGGGGGTPAPIAPEVTLPDWAKLMAEQIKAGQWAEAATTLTTELNRMVDSVDWAGMGQKLGHGIDNALKFLATFIMTFDWFNLGSKLAVGINNILYSVDWANLGIVLGAKFKILIEGLSGFFATFDWAALGSALSQAFMGLINSIDWAQAGTTLSTGLIGLLDAITVFIQETDWQQIGNQIALFLGAIDWTGLATALLAGIGAAFAGIGMLLWGLIEDEWNKFVDQWMLDSEACGGDVVAGLLVGIGRAIANIAVWIRDNIFKPFIDGFKNAFGIHSPSTVMQEQGGYIIQGLLNGLKQTWANVQTWLNELPAKFKDAFNSVLDWVRTSFMTRWGEAWSGLKNGVKGAVNGVISAINGMLSLVTAGVNRLFDLLSFNINIPGLGSVGLNLPQVSAPQIPYLAKGAVIPPNAPFAAVLGDQRHGNNIEAPEDLIRKIVREETAGRGMDDSKVAQLLEEIIEIIRYMEFGDETIGEIALRYMRRTERARGW